MKVFARSTAAWAATALAMVSYVLWQRAGFIQAALRQHGVPHAPSWIVRAFADPYLQIYGVLPPLVYLAVREGQWRARPMELMRRPSWSTAALKVASRCASLVIRVEGLLLFIVCEAGLGMTWSAPQPSSSAAGPGWEAVVSTCLGAITFSCCVGILSLAATPAVALTAAGVGYIAVITGFKIPELFGALNPAIFFSTLDTGRALPQVVLATLLALAAIGGAWTALGGRDREKRPSRGELAVRVALAAWAGMFLLRGNGETAAVNSFVALWGGVGRIGGSAVRYISLVLPTVLPLAGWLVQREASLVGQDMHLLRITSVHRFLRRETRRAVAIGVAGYFAALLGSALLAAIWGRTWGSAPLSATEVLLRLIFLGTLNSLVLALLLTAARLTAGTPAAAGTLAAVVAVGFLLAPAGFPFAQQGLALASGDHLGIAARAGILASTAAALLLIIHTWVAARIRSHGIPEGAQQ